MQAGLSRTQICLTGQPGRPVAKLKTDVILEAVDVATLLTEMKITFEKTANCYVLHCPLGTHADSQPSFLFYPELKRFHCKGCELKGDVISFVAIITGKDRTVSSLWLAKRFEARIKVTIDPREVDTWCEQLFRPESQRFLNFLKDRKGLTEETIRLYKIGLDSDKITIPVADADGSYVNIRYYNPYAASGRNKYSNYRDGSTLELVPWETLLKQPTVYLTEGELKAYALLQRGYPGLAPTSGANTWKPEWSELFRGKIVYIIFDIDRAGQQAAQKRAKELYAFARVVYLVHIPIDVVTFPKGDVCDFFGPYRGTKENFDAAVRGAKPWQPQQVREAERDNAVYKVSLASSTSAKFHAKRVEVDAIVSAKDTSPYLVPRKIVVACDRDQKCCAECPIYAQEIPASSVKTGAPQEGEPTAVIGTGIVIELDAESPKLLELIDVPTAKLAATLRRAVGIPERCASSTCSARESFAIEEVRLIPQINIASDTSGSAVVRAYYVGHGIETNASYKVRMRIFPDAKTQHAVGLIYEAEPNQDNLATFRLSDEQRSRLQIFQPTSGVPAEQAPAESLRGAGLQEPGVQGSELPDPTAGVGKDSREVAPGRGQVHARYSDAKAIRAQLDRIYDDLESNVTRIYKRRDLHLFMDLIWHTCLWMTFDGQVVKGWGDGIVIGDSGQGKSEVSKNLLKHYQLGEKVDSKSATVAGLLGGLTESHKRWIIQWGAIPLNHGRLVVLEEVKGMAEEVIGKLTDMRSSGIAELIKIEKAKTNACTRLLWITNPRSQRQIATYNHGVEAIREFAGSLEDVRRFDCAIVVASGQVPREIANMQSGDRPQNAHIFTTECCRDLLLWTWSRKAHQVTFTKEAIRAVLDAASLMGRDFSSGIPLVEPADQRFKIARLSVALAARLFSIGENDSVVVHPGHVEVCVEFLRRLYDDPVMGYREFSQSIQSEETIADPAEVKKCLLLTNHPRDLILSLQRQRLTRTEDIMNFSGLDRDGASRILSTLVRKNALLSVKGAYVKTPAFIAMLRDLSTGKELTEREAAETKFAKAGGEM